MLQLWKETSIAETLLKIAEDFAERRKGQREEGRNGYLDSGPARLQHTDIADQHCKPAGCHHPICHGLHGWQLPVQTKMCFLSTDALVLRRRHPVMDTFPA